MVLQQKGLTVLDAIITLCLIGVLFGVFASRYPRMAQEAQETALRSGLSNIRASVRLFRMMNGRNPRSLTELVEKEVLMPARVGADAPTGSVFQQKYLMERAVDKQGNIVDPFGNPFAYDPLRGEVKATTAEYENW
jgi:type II secretory pathway pseudopilin PulG